MGMHTDPDPQFLAIALKPLGTIFKLQEKIFVQSTEMEDSFSARIYKYNIGSYVIRD